MNRFVVKILKNNINKTFIPSIFKNLDKIFIKPLDRFLLP